MFTIPAYKAVTGTVYALDIDPEMVAATADSASRNLLTNVSVVERDFLADGSGRLNASVGYVMLFNILHVEEPIELLCEVFRMLHPAGEQALFTGITTLPLREALRSLSV